MPLKQRKKSIAYSAASRVSFIDAASQHSSQQYPNQVSDHDISDCVEDDVLFPQYLDVEEKLDRPSISDFDRGVRESERRASYGSALSRTISKQSRLYGESVSETTSTELRYCVYSGQKDRGTTFIPQLVSKEGREALDTMLQTAGWWLDCLNPTDEEMTVISKLFRIHALTVEDIQANEATEKIDLYPNYTFVCFRSFDTDQQTNQLYPYNFYNLIFKDGLLTVHYKHSPHPARVRHRIDQIKQHLTIVPDWINYALIDDITDAFAPVIRQVEMESLSIDELSLVLHKSERTDMLKRIGRCRKHATQLTRLLTPKLDVLRSLMKRYEEKWQRTGGYLAMVDESLTTSPEEMKEQKALNEVLLYLGDIQDHLVTMALNTSHCNRILSRAHTNYLAQVNVDLSMTYRETNQVMNRLTFMGTVFIPTLFIAGLFGMNVAVPGKKYLDLAFFFWIVLLMVSYSVLISFFGRKWKVL
ncbi:cora-domain-containing protein [Hesseltinella vesiculosa]|uniref:Cora-domain-containing protein n=1 Tax=Hesseltinella vesiculosa TaxID=101127 RepID=A0A1X2G8I5_9FUNG|nr:cora-domain-containing protein [Hesseltinella vesiculosa]